MKYRKPNLQELFPISYNQHLKKEQLFNTNDQEMVLGISNDNLENYNKNVTNDSINKIKNNTHDSSIFSKRKNWKVILFISLIGSIALYSIYKANQREMNKKKTIALN